MVLSVAQPSEAVLTGQGDRWSVNFPAMGTACRVDFSAPSRGRAAAIAREATAWVQNFESKYSRFRPDSLVSEINRAAGLVWTAIDADLETMLTLCAWFHWLTAGLFDPTTLPLSRLWDYIQPPEELPSEEAVAEARACTGWHKVERRPGAVRLSQRGMELDLGGIGKEYAVDAVCELVQRAGARDCMVDFGRDIRAYGHPPEGGPWRIGLEDPAARDRCWSGVALNGRAVATSGNYLRGFQRDGRHYGHILNPRTGRPSEGGAEAVSVLAPTCVEAGILATTAVILPPAEGLALISRSPHAAAAIWSGGRCYRTAEFHRYAI